jgi:hypothetical protein
LVSRITGLSYQGWVQVLYHAYFLEFLQEAPFGVGNVGKCAEKGEFDERVNMNKSLYVFMKIAQ